MRGSRRCLLAYSNFMHHTISFAARPESLCTCGSRPRVQTSAKASPLHMFAPAAAHARFSASRMRASNASHSLHRFLVAWSWALLWAMESVRDLNVQFVLPGTGCSVVAAGSASRGRAFGSFLLVFPSWYLLSLSVSAFSSSDKYFASGCRNISFACNLRAPAQTTTLG